jgi:membrane fusion protein (multidrug efflux system)
MELCSTKHFNTGAGMALLFASALLAGCSNKPAGPPPGAMGALPVGVVTVQQADVPLTGEWVGTMDGFVNAQIQPQVSGYLIRQDYREGSSVAKGQVLFEIDPRPFQAVLEQAQGQVGQAQGQVGQAQAQLGLAQINVKRDTPLAAQHAIAQSQLDNDKQQAAQAEATVRATQASVAAAQASVATAKLNLGFTKVRSLISGVAGQATIQVGNLVSPQSVLTAVSQLNPIKVYFSISDDEYLGLTRQARNGGSGDLLHSSSKIPLTLTLADGEVYPHTGHIIFVDRQMDQQTGAIRIAAVFPNPDDLLRPGQFGRVKAQTDVLHNALLVPQAAVQELQGLEQVFVVGADNHVHITNVTLGPQVGNDWVITSGLQPGARVVTDNLQKLRDGAPVSPHPGAATAPTTASSSDMAGR